MTSHPTDEDISHNIFYNNYQSELVSCDVEYHVLIADIIGRGEVFPDIREVMPQGVFHNLVPSFQRNSGLFVSCAFKKFLQLSTLVKVFRGVGREVSVRVL